jgi:hypothetical protein
MVLNGAGAWENREMLDERRDENRRKIREEERGAEEKPGPQTAHQSNIATDIKPPNEKTTNTTDLLRKKTYPKKPRRSPDARYWPRARSSSY